MRNGLVVCLFVLAAGLLVDGDLEAGSLEPPGPPAPTMKTLQQVESRTAITAVPITISTAGSYYLTGNLTGVSGQSGITITTSFVTVDLNGFSLIGVAGSLDGIRANTVGISHVEIRNGVVRNWGGLGVSALNATQVHAEDLRLDTNGSSGIAVGFGSIVRDTTSTSNGIHGILANPESTIIGCTARFNGSAGIALNSFSLISDCTANGNTGIGFSLTNGSRIVRSLARANLTGISGGEAVSVEECTAEANTDDGIRVFSSGLVRGNIARGNTNDGIQVTGAFNRIAENHSIQNGVGIRIDAGSNAIVKNHVGNNFTEYSIAGGNQLGPISTDPATAGPWANFDM